MAKRGENIYKRKDSRWEGRYIKGYDPSGKIHFGYVYAKTYREVKEKLSAAKLSQHAQVTINNKKKFDYYCDEWLLLSRNRVKESTYVKYYNMVNLHIKQALGKYDLQNLNTVVIEKFSNALLDKGFSPKTVRDNLVVLCSILKHCRKQIGAELPEIEIIYPKEHKNEMRVLTLEEQSTLIQYLLTDMDHFKFGVLLALLTGMRIGEICALRWADISIDQKLIHVRSTMQRLQIPEEDSDTKTKVIIGETKSHTSDRIIPLTDYAVTLCSRMQSSDENAFVLTGNNSHYVEPRALQYHLAQYTTECGLSGVHFHTLRHTFATRCVEVGFEIKSLSEVLGHASTKVTLDRYVHSSLQLKRENMDKLTSIGL